MSRRSKVLNVATKWLFNVAKPGFNVAKDKVFQCREEIGFFNVAMNGYLMLLKK